MDELSDIVFSKHLFWTSPYPAHLPQQCPLCRTGKLRLHIVKTQDGVVLKKNTQWCPCAFTPCAHDLALW